MTKKINISRSIKKLNPGSSNKSKNKSFKPFWRSSKPKLQVSNPTNQTLGITWRRNKLRKLGNCLENHLNQAVQPSPTFGTSNLLHQVAEAVLGHHNHLPVLPLLPGTNRILGHRTMGTRRIRVKHPPIGTVIDVTFKHLIFRQDMIKWQIFFFICFVHNAGCENVGKYKILFTFIQFDSFRDQRYMNGCKTMVSWSKKKTHDNDGCLLFSWKLNCPSANIKHHT